MTVGIDSACQTKPLLIGSHHVYSKTNFFQVLLSNQNTLLQPSSLFIITPKLIVCSTSSERVSRRARQQTQHREAKALSNPNTQALQVAIRFENIDSLQSLFSFYSPREQGTIMDSPSFGVIYCPVALMASPERNYSEHCVYVKVVGKKVFMFGSVLPCR